MRIFYLKLSNVRLIAPFGALCLFSCAGDKLELSTVNEVKLEEYAGQWYEIARLPNSFEKNLKCVTATYSLNEDGTVKVTNAGVNTETGEREEANGKAKVPAPEEFPGRLKVSFFWPFSGDYYIIDLDEEYQWALVGSPDRDYLWVLSRTKTIPENLKNKLLQKASDLGFDITALEFPNQDCNV